MIPLESVRVALPVQRRHEGGTDTLLPRTRLDTGDRVATGPRGRAALQFAGAGLITLGGNSSLFIHSATPPESGRGAVLRLQLERGALRLDARVKQSAPAQDYRINLGRLRMRVYGAEIWTELTASGESVCLLEGAVEVLSDAGSERLDQPGHCLLFTGSGQRLLVRPDTGETLARKLVRTAFAEDYVSRYAAEQSGAAPGPSAGAPSGSGPEQSQAPVPVEPSPMPAESSAASAPAAANDGGGGWTVVVASAVNAGQAAREVERLRLLGLDAQVRPHGEGPATRYRVTIGSHASRAEATAQAQQLKDRHALVGAWVLKL